MKGYEMATVTGVVARVWPEGQREKALGILARVTSEMGPSTQARLQLAAIKMSHADFVELERWVSTANGDYRDILMAAEYPSGLTGPIYSTDDPRFSAQKDADLAQYRKWLASVGADHVEPVAS